MEIKRNAPQSHAAADPKMSRVWVIMGAAGSGKSTTAEKVSFELKRIYKNRPAPVFIEGDDHHPPENKAKMSQGIPLDDTDRAPWLEAIKVAIIQAAPGAEESKPQHPYLEGKEGMIDPIGGKDIFVTCSALKKSYRDTLASVAETDVVKSVRFICLKVTEDELRSRLEKRQETDPSHPFGAALLQSQLETLEITDDVHQVDGAGEVRKVTGRVLNAVLLLSRLIMADKPFPHPNVPGPKGVYTNEPNQDPERYVKEPYQHPPHDPKWNQYYIDRLGIPEKIEKDKQRKKEAWEKEKKERIAKGEKDPRPEHKFWYFHPSTYRIEPETLDEDVCKFMDRWLIAMTAYRLVGELENRVIDHVCYRCETEEQYHDAVALMVGAGHEVAGTSIIGGRPISTIRLKKPIKWKKWEIPAVEIPMPKPGRPKRKGWEHAEVALMTDGDGKPLDFKGTDELEKLIYRHQLPRGMPVPWDRKGMDKDINAEVSTDLGSYMCVKFHNRPLLEVVEYELAHGMAQKPSWEYREVD